MHGRLYTIPIKLPSEPGVLDLRTVLEASVRRWRLIAVAGVMGLLASLALLTSMPPIYTATVVINTQHRDSILGRDSLLADLALQQDVEAQIVDLRSISLLRRVASEPSVERELASDLERQSSGIRTRVTSAIKGLTERWSAGSAETSDSPHEARIDSLVRRLREVVVIRRGSAVEDISVSVSLPNAQSAANTVNAFVRTFRDLQGEAIFARAEKISLLLEQRVEARRASLRRAENAVEEYRIKERLTGMQAGANPSQALSEQSNEITRARARIAEKMDELELAKRRRASQGDMQSVPSVHASNLVTALRLEMFKLKAQEAGASARGEQHPEAVRLRLQGQQIERQILEEIDAIITRLEDEIEAASAQLDLAVASVSAMTTKAEMDAHRAIGLRELERTAAADREIYERLLSRSRLAAEEMLLARDGAFVFVSAKAPEMPSFPNARLFTILGTALGLAIGGASGLYLHFRHISRTDDRRFHNT